MTRQTRERRGRLFWKYTIVLVALVSLALLASGGIELYFSYRENTEALGQVQREKALGAANLIEQFVREIERQIGWTTHPLLATGAAAVEQRRLDYFRLLRQVPPVTEISQIDKEGREQLRVSRLAMDVVGSGTDFSRDPRFVEPRPPTSTSAGRTYFSPVYFRKESEPYMTVAMASSSGPGVTAAEVNLKFIWDVVSKIKIGRAGRAYVVDAQGHLIAHPDISLVLKKTDLFALPQVQAALARPARAGESPQLATVARDLQGRSVLTAHADIAPLGWVVFVEQPLDEAFATLWASIKRTLVLLATGVALSVLASLLLARRMVTPIRALQTGAARLEAGALDQRIAVRTGDELEGLAEQFNRMAATLQESYAGLERKVEERTRELREALEQQTATADILRVISQSPTDVRPVLDAVVESAMRLCEAVAGTILLRDGDAVVPHAHSGPLGAPIGQRQRLDRGWVTGRAVLEGRTIHVADLTQASDDDYPEGKAMALRYGHRATLATPLLREGLAIGAILVRRREARPFSEKQVAILETFARQAVIAIENVRLFQELQTRNRELTEALEQQTVTGEILRVISSSPTDLQPVMTAIVENAARLADAEHAMIGRADGNVIRWLAVFGAVPLSPTGQPISRSLPSGRAILDRQTTQIEDVASIAHEFPETVGRAYREQGVRTVLATPLLREGAAIGVLLVRRTEVRPFSDKQIALLRTFADQAVIAIENVRLFQELEARNRDLTEALEQQTATAEILSVISRSQTDVQPVFETIMQNAVRLCGGHNCGLFRVENDIIDFVAHNVGVGPGLDELRRLYPRRADEATGPVGQAVRERAVVHVLDTAEDPSMSPWVQRIARLMGFRTQVVVPMRHGGRAVGAIVVTRPEVQPFSDGEIALLKTFADQAVIAIENVRLFQELQARTRDLAQSLEEVQTLSEVGQALSSSLDLRRVLDSVAMHAVKLSGCDACGIFDFDPGRGALEVVASHNLRDEFLAGVRATAYDPRRSALRRATVSGQPVQVPDILSADDVHAREISLREGFRAILAVPMGGGDVPRGVVLFRRTPGTFDDRVVTLLTALASQSQVAIENARLFKEVEDKSQQLTVANQHKSEFLANMSHELRTPLNAVIGFSEVLLERMFGDLNRKQEEYLQDIVASGRHLLSLINDILDLSKIEAGRMELELAGFDLQAALANALTLVRERALRRGIRLELKVDERLGAFVGDERKFKQILLNLLSNAVKFTPEGGRVTLTADLANGSVEVAVSDTGIGIAPEDQQAIFEEFRQVGRDYASKREGTGLGLTLAKKFVELHGGRIWVKSGVGQGSTFTFALALRSAVRREGGADA